MVDAVDVVLWLYSHTTKLLDLLRFTSLLTLLDLCTTIMVSGSVDLDPVLVGLESEPDTRGGTRPLQLDCVRGCRVVKDESVIDTRSVTAEFASRGVLGDKPWRSKVEEVSPVLLQVDEFARGCLEGVTSDGSSCEWHVESILKDCGRLEAAEIEVGVGGRHDGGEFVQTLRDDTDGESGWVGRDSISDMVLLGA